MVSKLVFKARWALYSAIVLLTPAMALAEGGEKPALAGFAAGMAIGLGAIGGAFGLSKVITASLDGISRNPSAAEKMFTPTILGLVFIELSIILSFVIALGLS